MMLDANGAPVLIQLLFGEGTGRLSQAALEQAVSGRLLRWCRAFEAWLESKPSVRKGVFCQEKHWWRLLLQERGQLPWELRSEDIQAHTGWLQAQGYSAKSVVNSLATVAGFYRWCDEHGVDPECAAGFNPARGVKRPFVKRYSETTMLSREEAAALLGVLEQDLTPLGRREHAFFLARLRLGVPLQDLKLLKWGQISQDGAANENESPTVAVRWQAGREPQPFPDEVWRAIRDYLEVSGRLAGMQAGAYIFAPLARPWAAKTGYQAGDWQEGRPLSTGPLLCNLKVYGRAVGIAEEKLTLRTLQRTALRLRLEAGEDLAGMKAFAGSLCELNTLKKRFKKIPELPAGDRRVLSEAELRQRVPRRDHGLFDGTERFIHGFYARRPEGAELEVILSEEVTGLREEISGLRWLASGLFERQAQAASREELVQLIDAYTQAAAQLGELIHAEKLLAEREQPATELFAALEEMRRESRGDEPEAAGEEAPQAARAPGAGGPSQLSQEIAAVRLVLRRAFQLAERATATAEYLHLVRVYGVACGRLARLLKLQGNIGEGSDEQARSLIDRALGEVLEELRSG